MSALITVSGLSRDYALPRTELFAPRQVRHALVDADLEVREGESLAIIGESGSGKSTLIRALLALDGGGQGEILFDGRRVEPGGARSLRWLRAQTGIVFQEPYASLDPRRTVGWSIAEPLRALGIRGDHRVLVRDVLARVGLHDWRAGNYPHELSGGQRQRVALARAIVHGPKVLIGDEPLSALDVTIRAQILDLLRELRAQLGLTIVLVSHDIGLVQRFSDRLVVLKDGRIVETGEVDEVLAEPRHPYTRRLLDSVPTLIEEDA
ncbi:ABC transporter ATP-binding protein [Microbacterium tumbae]